MKARKGHEDNADVPKIEFQYAETFLRECESKSEYEVASSDNNNDDVGGANEKCQDSDELTPNYLFLNSPFYANINYNQVCVIYAAIVANYYNVIIFPET